MRPRLHPLSYDDLAAVYGLSRQGAADLVRRHGYDIATSPQRLFVHLLELRRAGKVRRMLSDPSFRRSASEQLQSLARP